MPRRNIATATWGAVLVFVGVALAGVSYLMNSGLLDANTLGGLTVGDGAGLAFLTLLGGAALLYWG